jgi:hypothetical protein
VGVFINRRGETPSLGGLEMKFSKIKSGDSGVIRGQIVTVETVHEDGTIFVIGQNGEGIEVTEADFDHVY